MKLRTWRHNGSVTGLPWLTPPATFLLNGDEQIQGADACVRDFWAWTLSDLRANTVRSVFAEFLVARAVDAGSRPRVEWDAYDVLTPDGYRLEVKSGAYLQAWNQAKLSTITFTGLRGRTWSPEAGYTAEATYNADAYVFALLTATEQATYDALDLRQWVFWVVSQAALASTNQDSIRLSRIQALGDEPVGYAELAERIRHVLAEGAGPPSSSY
jgi:hypothetical protein